MQKTKVRVMSFPIPNAAPFPKSYRNGMVEVGVWPPVGVMPSVLDREGGRECLEQWAIYNILLGYLEGDYTEADLRKERVFIRAYRPSGQMFLNTFDWGEYFEPEDSDRL
jgi:hypothetical protein